MATATTSDDVRQKQIDEFKAATHRYLYSRVKQHMTDEEYLAFREQLAEELQGPELFLSA